MLVAKIILKIVGIAILCMSGAQLASAQVPYIDGQIGGHADTIETVGDIVYWGSGPSLSIGRFNVVSQEVEIISRSIPFDDILHDIWVEGSLVYVTHNGALQILDCTDLDSPIHIGTWETVGGARRVVVANRVAYIADAVLGLRVVDASDPTNPVEATQIFMASGAIGLALSGNNLFVVDGSWGIRVYDISNPTNPVNAGQFPIEGLNGPITIDGNLIYSSYTNPVNNADGMLILDFADLQNPRQRGFFGSGREPTEFHIAGSLAYMTIINTDFRAVDITDPDNPLVPIFQGAFYDTPGRQLGLAVNGNFAYVADGYAGLRVLDIRDIDEFEEVGSYEPGTEALDIAVQADRAYVAAREGLRVLDVQNPRRMNLLGGVDTQIGGAGIDLVGNDLYFLEIGGIVRLFDIGEPQNIRELANVDVGGLGLDLVVRDDFAFVVNSFGQSLDVLEHLRNPDNLVPRGDFSSIYIPSGIAIQGDLLYIANMGIPQLNNFDGGLRIIDISNPTQPRSVINLPPPARNDVWEYPETSSGIAVDGAYAYIMFPTELLVMDVSDPRLPREATRLGGFSEGIAIYKRGKYAYITDADRGLVIVDLSDPLNPREIETVPTVSTPLRVAVAGAYAYVTDEEAGIYAIKVHPTIEFERDSDEVREDQDRIDVTIQLSDPMWADVTVEYRTTGGTATRDADYRTVAGTATIPAGQTSTTITVQVIDDDEGEADETIELSLTGPDNAVIDGNDQILLTITDDDGGLLAGNGNGDNGGVIVDPLANPVGTNGNAASGGGCGCRVSGESSRYGDSQAILFLMMAGLFLTIRLGLSKRGI